MATNAVTSINSEDAFDSLLSELNPSPLVPPADLTPIIAAPQAQGMEFDKRALYGKLGALAVATTMPLGWAYVGILAVASALDITDRDGHVHPNLYAGMIAPVGMSKTAVAEAIEKSIFLPSLTVSYNTPGSDRGLVKMIGNEGNTTLLIEDEFRGVLDKCAIPNSTLPKVICKLWSKRHAGVSDKKGIEECDGKLCILGNIPCEDASDFSRAFGSSTTKGMYDRFLFGYDTKAVKYRPLSLSATVFPTPLVVRVPTWVWEAKDLWAGDNPERRRTPEMALRVALVSAACNGDKEITAKGMAAALRLMELQERIRKVFRPGLAETKDAEAYEAIHAALLEQRMHQLKTSTFPKGADETGHGKILQQGMLQYRDIMTVKNYYRKYGTLVSRVKSMMLEEGILLEVHPYETDDRGNVKRSRKKTGFFILDIRGEKAALSG